MLAIPTNANMIRELRKYATHQVSFGIFLWRQWKLAILLDILQQFPMISTEIK